MCWGGSAGPRSVADNEGGIKPDSWPTGRRTKDFYTVKPRVSLVPAMSRSPERISSYRRHFEDSSSSSTYQVRVSSPSPTRREVRHASAGYSARTGSSSMRVDSVGRRNVSAARRSRIAGVGVSAGAMVCVGPSGKAPMDLDAAAAENQEFLSTRTNERQEMIVLNDRLAVYIDKVRMLEQKNKLLEAEIEAYQNRFQKPTGLRLLYEEQLKELKKIADQMRVQRDISFAAKEAAAGQLEAIKIRYEEALELRKKAELEIEAFRPDVDKATSSRIALEKKLEQLEVEIEFLKRIHQQEIEELMKQIYAAHVSAESAFSLPDLAGALKQIQTQYDDIAAKNLQEMDSWYKNKFEDLTKKTSRHVDKVRSVREEIAGAKKDIQNKERGLDSLRTKNEALEVRIRETLEKHKKELEELQARIEALQLELKSIKTKIALHLREYQDLLNIKMALEIEITTYRKLIEGEDLRLSGMMNSLSVTSCSMSAIGAGVSISGGSIGGVGGLGGGPIIGGGRGGVGGMVGGLGLSADMVAGVMGSRSADGKVPDGRSTGDMDGPAGRAGIEQGGVGVRAGTESLGTDGRMNASGVSGFGSGSFGPGTGKVGTVGSSVGVLGVDPEGSGFGTPGLSTDVGGEGSIHRGMGDRSGIGAHADGDTSGLAGVVGAAGVGFKRGYGGETGGRSTDLDTCVGGVAFGSGGIGDSSGVETRADRDILSLAGGVHAAEAEIKGVGLDTGVAGVGLISREMGGSGGVGTQLDGDISGGVSAAGMGLGRGGAIEGRGTRVDGVMGDDGGTARGVALSETRRGISGAAGPAGRSGEDVGVALSGGGGVGGVGRLGGGKGDICGVKTGSGSDGFDRNTESYVEQAVELTERRTVLIRTVKKEDDVLEMDHQEQTYTITGAANDSDVE
ncbi:keratin, type II cytoskeletal 8 [Gambusia affinis]|uniref:keratin, type II cytoskeletal 8 n=1 Tax=Gambusia affinis TaxID=33528 RepID=UPI001CDBE4F3|nr:keratin, type II cytoskeletal 8 [Gambusia affinis]